MKLESTQEQKEQVWRALGFRQTTEDEKRILRVYGHGADWRTDAGQPIHERSLPKPEDVLWQLRALAIEKDAGLFTRYLGEFAVGVRMPRDYATATPQQIFEAALKTLEDE